MKTRNEMIYDFMIALSSNPEQTISGTAYEKTAEWIYHLAYELANKYLESQG